MSRFIHLADLVAGDRIRMDNGSAVTVEAVETLPHQPHARIRFLGGESIVVPFGARFTRHTEHPGTSRRGL